MVSTARPIARLRSLARADGNGELICAASHVEIHVFLQRGRIAWATDSLHPFAFATHLQGSAQIDPDTLRQVVEECRRERLPLGQTLVEWGLATWDGVRTSLAHQISLAVSQLATVDLAQTLFLERPFGNYNERLTFEVTEFISNEPVSPATAQAAPPTPEAMIAGGPPGLARQLRGSIEGLSWVEILEDEHGVDGDPPCPALRVPLELVRTTVLDGCDFVAIRSARSSVVGLSATGPRSIWCRLAPESTFGGVVSAIWSVAGAAAKASDPAPARPDVAAWALGETEDAETTALASFQHRAHEVLGAIVLTGDPAAPSAGSGCSLIEPERCVDLARRRAHCLSGEAIPLVDPGECSPDSIGYSLRTMVSGEAQFWCFGAELARDKTLWMFLDRRTSQGLGWAYMSALTRALARSRADA